MEWAVIEPDPALVRSTRALGGADHLAQARCCVRVLRQYLSQA